MSGRGLGAVTVESREEGRNQFRGVVEDFRGPVSGRGRDRGDRGVGGREEDPFHDTGGETDRPCRRLVEVSAVRVSERESSPRVRMRTPGVSWDRSAVHDRRLSRWRPQFPK